MVSGRCPGDVEPFRVAEGVGVAAGGGDEHDDVLALLVGLLAVVSMTLANLTAYWQQDPRRMLGWSTVSRVGFLLVPAAVAARSDLALPSLLLYLLGYTVTNIAAFASRPRYRGP